MPPRLRSALQWLVAAVIVGSYTAFCFVAGRGSAQPDPDTEPTALAQGPVTGSTGPARTPPPAGLLSGSRYPRTRGGAGAAAGTYAVRLAGLALGPTKARARAYPRFVSSGSLSRLLTLGDSSSEVVRENLGARRGPVVARGVPFGYRVVSFNPSVAVVDVWSVAIVGGPARTPEASWQSNLITLKWERNDWRLDDFRTGPGITPTQRRAPTSPAELIGDATRYETYDRVAP